MAEKLEEANRIEAEKTKLTAREKVKESLGLKQAVIRNGVDVESSTDSDIGCYLKPKGLVKKTTTRALDRRQGKPTGIKKKKKVSTAAWSKKNGLDSGLSQKKPRLSPENKATNLLEDSTGRTESRPLKKEQLDGPAHVSPAEDTKPGKEED